MGKTGRRAFQTEKTACTKYCGIENTAKERRQCGSMHRTGRVMEGEADMQSHRAMRFTCTKTHFG